MPGVVLEDGEAVDVGVEEKNYPPEPPADPRVAPKGWRFERSTKSWIPRKRAAKPDDADGPGDGDDPQGRLDSAWATGPDGLERQEDAERPDFLELSDQQKDDIAAILELAALPLLVGMATKDPYCGGALVDNWDNIRDKSLPVIAKSPALVEWLTKAGGFRDWLMFAAALRPVGSAVWHHHITHTVELEEGGGPVREEDLGHYAA